MTLFGDKNQVGVLDCLCPFTGALSTNEFGKNVELFVRVRGYGVCGGDPLTGLGGGGMGVSPLQTLLMPPIHVTFTSLTQHIAQGQQIGDQHGHASST